MEGLSLVGEEEDGFSLKIQEDTGHNYDIEVCCYDQGAFYSRK